MTQFPKQPTQPRQQEPGLPKVPPFMQGDMIDKKQPLATVPKKIEPRLWLAFGWLADAVLNEQKTGSLRDWGVVEANEWKRRQFVYAFDEPPSKGGKRLALLEITQTPYKVDTKKLRKSDYVAFGLAYAQAFGLKSPSGRTPEEIWEGWKNNSEEYYVIRFRVIQVYDQLAPQRKVIHG
ncbi:MAG TPA: hypothetical protein ENI23_04040 [bacterium]|nr:hypothetical protein [bacterium]